MRPVTRWVVYLESRVGRIQATLYAPGSHFRGDETTYMLHSTGIGTGSVYDERDCYATHEEAEAECARRNVDPFDTWLEQRDREAEASNA